MSSLCEECDVIRSVEEYVPKELQMAEQNEFTGSFMVKNNMNRLHYLHVAQLTLKFIGSNICDFHCMDDTAV